MKGLKENTRGSPRIDSKRTDADPADDDRDDHFEKRPAVECICPKCGIRHQMNFRWIGRGTPRKFCPLCKGTL